VEQAESSPAAAKEGAYIIRKFLQKDNGSRPYVQYNAVMLIRILTDHPGKTFTRNMDGKFVTTVKELLREGKDMSVQQILRETLDNFQYSKSDDETLKPMISMWSEYKGKMAKKGNYNPGLVSPHSAIEDYRHHRERNSPSTRAPCSLALPHPARFSMPLRSRIVTIADTTAPKGCRLRTSSHRASRKRRHPPNSSRRWSNQRPVTRS
jgi:hypothetical protein